ncbi:ATP-binding protein [Sessilibacter corallicola]|uniref:ATP-binding protein n=1 Tax=Sessilibacter corallicola TaxID=2904075 RepID=UPI001E514AE7|nr:ATP-binding protein [Sessilibacter corallicola]MCE2027202.1 ATP-binding protein [Sessilibacter corallicola]
MLDWSVHKAAVWRPKQAYLKPVTRLDSIGLNQLLQIDRQKSLLVDNTTRFLQGLPANNALLWGARGTGKSSLVKALLNEYFDQGLRVIEVDKADLEDLPEIVDLISDCDYRFILFCDDLSFENDETNYKHLKSILEGSIELPPENLLLYATSNRRHLIPQTQADNQETLAARMADSSVLHSDTVEEKLSLADRFGLWLSFYPISWQEYFKVVDLLFASHDFDQEILHQKAALFARTRGTNSARTAKQFYQSIVEATES